MITTLIVDDEQLARERIKSFLNEHKDFIVSGECNDSESAINFIIKNQPEVLFLDIQMPDHNGFDILEKVKDVYLPLVIFVTAYDNYAIKAFEFHAVDYLLKPFDRKRFNHTLNHIREIISAKNSSVFNEQIFSLIDQFKKRKSHEEYYPQKIAIKESGKISLVNVNEIEYVESAGNYVKIITGKTQYLMRETMNNLETRLNKNEFLRIHRSIIVKTELIKELKSHFNNEYILILKNGKQFKTGNTYKQSIAALIDAL